MVELGLSMKDTVRTSYLSMLAGSLDEALATRENK